MSHWLCSSSSVTSRHLSPASWPWVRSRGSELSRAEQHRRMIQSGTTGRRAARKVLIVEDNELNMKLLNDLLEAHGYTILQAKDGLEALRIARLHRPDAVTALAMPGDEEKIRQAGCEAYLAKPISIAGFMQAIEHHLSDAT